MMGPIIKNAAFFAFPVAAGYAGLSLLLDKYLFVEVVSECVKLAFAQHAAAPPCAPKA